MNTPVISWPMLRTVARMPSALRMLISLAAGVGAWLLCPASLTIISHAVAAWDAFGVVMLLLLWAAIVTADVERIRVVAASEDLSRAVSFIFVLVAASASLLAVVALLRTFHDAKAATLVWHITLSVVAVGAAWLLVHTVFTLRYAHAYYDADEDGSDVGGLDFPGKDPEPDYLDIAYFAFVVGMTAQTADVSISGRTQRRIALLHGLISFLFNTTLIALVISGVSSVL